MNWDNENEVVTAHNIEKAMKVMFFDKIVVPLMACVFYEVYCRLSSDW
ncbi:MAG: hypothetical protein ACI80S_001789 [Pseudohongiellaceae bacterium]